MSRIINKKLKKTLNLFLASIIFFSLVILMGSLLGACATEADEPDADLKIVTTLFVSYDFARSISGEQADVSMLLPPGVDVHSFEPTPQDIIKLNDADLLIYNGGHSEAWVKRLLDSGELHPENTLRMMDFVELREETVSGIIEIEAEHDHDHEDDHEHDHDHEQHRVDEHIWTSPVNAVAMSAAIRDKLIEIDADNAGVYTSNFDVLADGLTDLHHRFQAVVAAGERDFIIVGDRFPLIYFVAEYGLNYYAAYEACAAESEPKPRTVTALIDLVKETDAPYLFTIEFSNERLADQISAESGADKLQFHTVHNVTQEQISEGATYISLMQQNVRNLEKALNE